VYNYNGTKKYSKKKGDERHSGKGNGELSE
jgi:hypothetical protein